MQHATYPSHARYNFIFQPALGTAWVYGLPYDTFMHTIAIVYSSWFCNGDCIWAHFVRY